MPLVDPKAKRAYQQAYHAKNRERLLAAKREKRLADPEKAKALAAIKRAKARAYRLAYPEKVRANHRKSYRKHQSVNLLRARNANAAKRDENNAKKRAYYAFHREELCLKSKEYRKKNLSLRLELNRKRRALQRQVPVNDLSLAQWEEIQAAYKYRCVYCDKKTSPLTQDHLSALSKDGSHTLWNIVPACVSCNARKKDRPVLCAVQPLLLTLAPAREE